MRANTRINGKTGHKMDSSADWWNPIYLVGPTLLDAGHGDSAVGPFPSPPGKPGDQRVVFIERIRMASFFGADRRHGPPSGVPPRMETQPTTVGCLRPLARGGLLRSVRWQQLWGSVQSSAVARRQTGHPPPSRPWGATPAQLLLLVPALASVAGLRR